MSEKLQSPSSSSNGGGAQTPRAKRDNGDQAYITIYKQPPTHVYNDEIFEIEFGIEFPRTDISPRANGEVQIETTLLQAKGGRQCTDEATHSVEPPLLAVPLCDSSPQRTATKVACRINAKEISRERDSSFVIRLAARDQAQRIAASCTRTIHAVNHKIRVMTDEDWEDVFYKDEGGRDKSMEVHAGLYDKYGKLLVGEQVPLHVSLFYDAEEGPIRVMNQKILKLGSAQSQVHPQVDKKTGKARIRFRIEEVSKNHQGHDFILQIHPSGKGKGYKDVGPGFTLPVSVKSKRNKRQRSSASSLPLGSERRSSPLSGRPKPGPFEDIPQRDNPSDGADITRVRDAMQGVINWTEEVVHRLYHLQWQVLGYAQNPDGSPDYSRPHHSMPNPNESIQRILSVYNESTRGHLRVLSDAVEHSRSTQPRGESYAGIPQPEMYPSVAPGGSPPEMYRGIPPGPQPEMYPGVAQAHHPPPMQQTPMQQTPRLLGNIGNNVSEVFREKPDHPMHYPPPMPPRHPQEPYMRRHHPTAVRMDESEAIHPGMQPMQPHQRPEEKPPTPSRRQRYDEAEASESEVEYVLAKQYKAVRTGEHLGFPAFSASKDILGFYRESTTNVGVGQFIPISRHRDEFGPLEILQATDILEDAIRHKSDAVHALKDWGSISNLINHALVYDWSKDISSASSKTTGVD